MVTANQSARFASQSHALQRVTAYQQRIQTSQVDRDSDAAKQPDPIVLVSPGVGKTILIVDPHFRLLASMMRQARRPEGP